MRRSWAAGAAIVLCLSLAGMPTLAAETAGTDDGIERTLLYEITIPSAAIPIGLAKIPVDQWTVAPGVDAETKLANEAIRGRGCLVRSGSFIVRPGTEAFVWRAPDAIGGPAETSPAGEPVTLAEGDLILLPAVPDDQVDAEASVGLANPGTSEAVVLCFHMHQPGGVFFGWPVGFASTSGVTHFDPDDMDATEAGEPVFRLTELRAPVDSAIGLPEEATYGIYIVEAGDVGLYVGGGTTLLARTDPPRRITVAGEEPAVLLELAVMTEAADVVASRGSG